MRKLSSGPADPIVGLQSPEFKVKMSERDSERLYMHRSLPVLPPGPLAAPPRPHIDWRQRPGIAQDVGLQFAQLPRQNLELAVMPELGRSRLLPPLVQGCQDRRPLL